MNTQILALRKQIRRSAAPWIMERAILSHAKAVGEVSPCASTPRYAWVCRYPLCGDTPQRPERPQKPVLLARCLWVALIFFVLLLPSLCAQAQESCAPNLQNDVVALRVALAGTVPGERDCALQALKKMRRTDVLDDVLLLLDADNKTIVDALEIMSSLCDARCTPLVSELMRHEDSQVQQAAVGAAARLGDPAFVPALLWLLRNVHEEELKSEVVRAILAIGDEQSLEALVHLIDPLKPEPMQLWIIQGLMSKGSTRYFSKLLEWAAYEQYYSSVVAAMSTHAALLEPQFSEALRDVMGSASEALLVRLMADAGVGLWSMRWESLVLEQPSLLPEVARIIARVDSDDARQWMARHIANLDEVSLLGMMPSVHAHNVGLLANDWVLGFEQYPYALQREVLRQLASCKSWSVLALLVRVAQEQGGEENLRTLGLRALLQYSGRTDLRVIFSQLLWDNSEELRWIAAEYWAKEKDSVLVLPQLIQARETQQVPGEVLWAYVQAVHKGDLEAAAQVLAPFLQDLHQPHAQSAFLLNRKFGLLPARTDWDRYKTARADVQRSLLELLVERRVEGAAVWVQHCLSASDVQTRGAAIWAIGRLGIREPWGMEAIREGLRSPSAELSINALASAGILGLRELEPEVRVRLFDANEAVSYNALWALQQLKTLPEHGELRALYYRSNMPTLRSLAAKLLALQGAYDVAEHVGNTDEHFGLSLRRGAVRLVGEAVILQYADGCLRLLHSDISGRVDVFGFEAKGLRWVQD